VKEISLQGVLPAAIVPMTQDYEIDYRAYAGYLDWLVAENAVGLAINMDTGEGPQLSPAERRSVAETAVAVAKGRCPVVAGLMGATTSDAVRSAREYREIGVDGLVVFPNAGFRNLPLDARIPYGYHKAIADEAGLPIILFQLAPVFGGTNFSREVLLRLIEIPEVVAIKEASFDVQYFAFTAETLGRASRPITLLTGNDRFITESFLLGAQGALLGFCAIGCGMVAEMLGQMQRGRLGEATAMRARVQGFADVIYRDPVLDYRARCKVALSHIGVIPRGTTYVRPPLLQIEPQEQEAIGEALARAGMAQAARATGGG